jgi:sulfide:quinone oxidoreductase
MTARELKQGGLAAQQADVAAAAIAAGLGATVPVERYRPVLRAMLLTGEAPVYLRHPAAPTSPRPHSTTESPWWPPHKIAGVHLAPYLATHSDLIETVTADVQ